VQRAGLAGGGRLVRADCAGGGDRVHSAVRSGAVAGSDTDRVTGAEQQRAGNFFVALPLEGEAFAAAQALLETAAERVEAVRWARPEGLHLTLHFFGRLPEADRGRVIALLAPVAATFPPLDVCLGGLGRFPLRGPARVLWAGVSDGAAEVVKLADACRDILGTAGFAVDKRPHHPHCTLGRPSRWSAAQRVAWEGLQPRPQPSWRAGRLVLFESQQGRGGSRYLERDALSLTG
jgi:2'-5' RNA ligase